MVSLPTGREPTPAIERLLIVRLSAMGDIIHALPAVTALRNAFPSASIGWLIEERWAELLCALPRRVPVRDLRNVLWLIAFTPSIQRPGVLLRSRSERLVPSPWDSASFALLTTKSQWICRERFAAR